MQNRRQVLADVFSDTQQFYTENAQLAAAVESSKQCTILYEANDYPPLPEKNNRNCKIEVTKNKTFEAAIQNHKECPDARIAVLNFASAINPGGGVKHGSSAQEESLCRCSTLYPTLDRRFLWNKYYSVNRGANNPLHTDACIWSPGIVICKSDTSVPSRLSPDEWVTIDVISCAAPNLRGDMGNIYNPEDARIICLSPEEQYQLHVNRAKHILHIAASHSIDTLILGAFGCGAFENDPYAVATAYRDVLPEFKEYFSKVEFAVYCRNSETENYTAFKNTISMD